MSNDDFLVQWNQTLESIAHMNKILSNAVPSFSISLQTLEKVMNEFASSLSRFDTSYLESITAAVKQFSIAVSKHVTPALSDSISQLADSMSRFVVSCTSINVDCHKPFSDDVSIEFVKISNDIFDNISAADLPEEICEEVSKAKKESIIDLISFDKIITLITLIIMILTLVHEFLPDKTLVKIEKDIQQLLELQNRQIELIESFSNSQELPLE